MVLPVPAEMRGQKITDNQRAQWAFQAGFTGDALVTAVAVSLAENKDGRIDAIGGPNFDGSFDYGMWQINSRAHGELFTEMPQWWSQYNAQMAKRVYDEAGGSFAPWSTYKARAHEAYLGRAKAAAQGSLAPTAGGPGSTKTVWDVPDALAQVGNTITGLANGVKAIAVATSKTAQWVAKPDNWARVAQVVIGGGLLIAATTTALKPLTAPITSAVVGVATKGAAGGGKARSSTGASSNDTKAE